jgi:AcrR family transcriptional regulator
MAASTSLLSHADPTKQALLEAAAAVFAESGFQLARVRSIAARAGTNVAAVNYHFGSKEGLYFAVLHQLMSSTFQRFPLVDNSVPAGRDPAERFAHAVENLLRRFASPEQPTHLRDLMVRELANPTGALDRLLSELARPQFLTMRGLVSELLGPRAGEREIVAATFSVVGQCIFYLLARPIIARFHPEAQPGSDEDIRRLAAHVARFSLAGLEATRRAIERP